MKLTSLSEQIAFKRLSPPLKVILILFPSFFIDIPLPYASALLFKKIELETVWLSVVQKQIAEPLTALFQVKLQFITLALP